MRHTILAIASQTSPTTWEIKVQCQNGDVRVIVIDTTRVDVTFLKSLKVGDEIIVDGQPAVKIDLAVRATPVPTPVQRHPATRGEGYGYANKPTYPSRQPTYPSRPIP